MKYVDEFRDPGMARRCAALIDRFARGRWSIMEVCGGQTHAILRHGIDRLLPDRIELLHGPGCPVCVTPIEVLDRAIALSMVPGVTLATFGDMIRVPGSHLDLSQARARGGRVEVVPSPVDALRMARRHEQDHEDVVFFGVGFETTLPTYAQVIRAAEARGVENFSILVSAVRIPPAMEALVSRPESRIDAFLAAGHVSTVMGTSEYEALAAAHWIPVVVTGFEPLDLLQGILLAVLELEQGGHRVRNQYSRSVRPEGNPHARALIEETFEIGDRNWRGIGVIPRSGFFLRERYARFDAAGRYDVEVAAGEESPACKSGLVLQGLLLPSDCPAFGNRCTPRTPLGATMVSSEGACAAYYRYRRREGGEGGHESR